MKPLSLEGLRRLVRGGRDKQGQQQPDSHHFRRSSSFKRASLRRSARRHEKITLPNGLVVKTSALQRKSSVSSDERRDDGYSTDGGEAGGCGTSSTGLPRRVITYDEWRVAVSDEDSLKHTDESLPSTLSTNKLSSLDSGVRHSLDSKKKFSIDSTKRLSLDRRKTLGVDIGYQLGSCGSPLLARDPRRGLDVPNFRRSVSAESPVPPLRIKSLLGSPRVAPKTREPPTTPARSLHSTPSRTRASQPLSAPPTPGKTHVHHLAGPLTPTHQLRASWHERETRRCAVHMPPGSPKLAAEAKAQGSPKPQSRWSALFSGNFFSRSPSKKNQQQIEAQQQLEEQRRQQELAELEKQHQHYLYNTQVCGGSPALVRQRSVHSCESPSLLRHSGAFGGHPTGPVSLGGYGMARAQGGPRPRNDLNNSGPRSLGVPSAYGSPSAIPRHLMHESSPMHRQVSHEYGTLGRQTSQESGHIGRRLSHESGPMSRQVSHDSGPMSRQVSHDSGPMSRQISHDSGPMSRQISHDSGPMSRQISHDSGPMSRQISHDSGPMSRQISHDSGPMSRQISHDSGPISRQISHDSGPMSRQISHDSGPMSRQFSHDPGPMSRQISHDSGPMSRQISQDSGPMSRQMSQDSGPMSRQMSHDSGPMSRQISHDSEEINRQISLETVPMNRQMSHDAGPMSRQMSHDTGPMSRQMSHDTGPMNRQMSHDMGPLNRQMAHDTVPMNRQVSADSGPMSRGYYHESTPLPRHLSHEPPPPGSPSMIQRHRSIPSSGLQSPVFRPRPLSSPAATHSLKALQVLGEAASVVNSSQFYPGKLGGSNGFSSGLPSVSPAGVRPSSSDRTSSRTSSQERPVPPIPPVPTHRPRTPVSMIRHAVHPGRPLSLAMSSSPPCPDLISPASATSQASSRAGKRRRGPGLLVGRACWLARAASSRKSVRQARRAKKAAQQLHRQKEVQTEELDERVPGRAGQALGPEAFQAVKDRKGPAPQLNSMVFVPPQRRRSSGSVKIQHTLLRRLDIPEIRTAHAHLLMPLNQPVGSHMVDGRSQKAAQLVRSMLEEEEQEGEDGDGVRDTISEPGGVKFSVNPGKKPKSEPNTARLNLRVTRNPELVLKALGVLTKIGKAKPEQGREGLPNEAANERIITQLLLKDLIQGKGKPGQGSHAGSAESLVESLVSSRGSNGAARPVRRIRRKKSQKRQPTVPAYPSWKRTPRLRSPRGNNGDITQKGYEKKKARLLQPYVIRDPTQGAQAEAASPSTRSRRRAQRRVTRNESRYHSEVRQEAVKEALAQYQSRPKNLPLPSKRSSVMTARSPDRHHRDSDSEDSDEDSVTAEGSLGSSGGHSGSQGTPEVPRTPLLLPPPQVPVHGSGGGTPASSSGSSHHTPPPHPVPPKQQQPLPPIPPHSLSNGGEEERRRREMTEVTDLMRNITSFSQPPDVTNNTSGGNNRAPRDDRITRYSGPLPGRQSSSDADGWRDALYHFPENWRGTGRWKVSSKIQQLLNTLKRPKRRPLPEFYMDDEEDLEIAANPKDPSAPKPEGMVMTPARGEQLVIPAGLPRSVEDAVYRYGSSSGYKAPVATVLDANGKLSVSLTYGKLLSRSQKMAYNLLTRLGGRGEGTVMPGDRVALVYPNNDPVSFMCAFYACLQAGLVPVPIEVPLSRRDAGSQQIGFLLGSCGVSVALTSEACFKGMPKTSAGEVVCFKGWPKLTWFITDHLPKPPKDWQTPPRHSDDTAAYIEYCTDKDGSVKGVVVTRTAMLAHCRTLTSACNYTEGEVAVCVLDFKREVGLWHSMLCSVFNGMHVIFIPYSVMKVNPASWMHMITRFKASIAIVKSRDLHWGLLATKDHKDVSLQSLRLLLVADGANPWSLSSCDQFLAVFQSKGLRPDAICPCASSPEALTVSVRRPGHGGANAVGRGVLSMQGLSYGVVRVDQENSLTSLTLQDCGQVLPGAMIVVVKLEGQPYLCRTDEVGEICVAGGAVGDQYWGLQGMTNTTFRVQPLLPDSTPMSDSSSFVRTGLLGFLGPGGLVFVCGSRDGLMTVTGRKHNTDDIIATVLAVEPMKFIYRGRIAVFSHKVLRDERICVIAEQRPDCSEEESFQWMSRVLQAVDSIHQVGIYCLALVPPNHLPKTPLGGIHLSETRKKFLEGSLHPANVLMCPHTCVTNLPKPREVHHDVGPASVMVGNLVQGNRLASAQGRELGPMDNEDGMRRHPQFIADILKWRASTTENHEILTLLNSKGQVATSLTCAQLHKKAERVGCLLLEKGHINTGDHVALIYPPGVDLIASFYGCLYVGAVPVTIRPPHPQNLQSTVNTVRTVVEVSKSSIILSTMTVIKLLKSKEEKFDSGKKWPPILDTDDLPKKRLPSIYKAPTPEMIAYLDFSVSTTGMLAGIKMSHGAATSLCLSMKVACELYPSRVVALCLDPYCGLGLALWVLSSIYSGHQSILIPPGEVELNPSLWLSAVSQYKVRDTFCSYGVMELCTKGLGSSIALLKQRGVNLACVRTCVVVAEERPRVQLTNSFSKLFSGLGLSPRAVSTSFGCRVNVAICLQGASSPDPTTVYVDLRSLRHDRVTLVERGAPHSLCIMESGKLLPGVKVVIANPETKGQCSDSHLGEIWVQCNHNASGYFTVYGDDGTANDHFNAQLVTGNTGEIYARTGYLGFLRRTESVQADGELHDAVFVVGALDETVILRGMRYHPIDIETTVMRCHKKISECAVFTWTNLLVVVVELDGAEYEALDLVPLITSSVLEEHQVIVGVVVVVDPGVVPINSRGEKQRMHLRDGFLADQLDPIYVAYNM